MLRSLVLLGLMLAATNAAPIHVETAAELGPTLERVRVFAKSDGDRLWPGYGEAPFGFLLVDRDRETLLCQDPAVSGFTPDGTDPATACARATRPRTALPDGLLAAMPIFGEHQTIVMGTPQATGRSRAEWVRTILHEHFHQYQGAFPHYFDRVAGLGLAGPSKSGAWMLNYPFPYSDPKVAAAYVAAANSLADAVALRRDHTFLPAFDRYLAARGRFEATVSERDRSYLEFELWLEGTARWTEITLGERFPDPDVRDASTALEARTLAKLRTPDLARQGREIVYPYGAAEVMLLDACDPAWRATYPNVLSLGDMLVAARRTCEAPRPDGR